MKPQLVFVLLVMSLGALWWAVLDYQNAAQFLNNSQSNRAEQEDKFATIAAYRKSTGDALVPFPQDIDVYPVIDECARKSGIELSDFVVRPTKVKQASDAKLRHWRLAVPEFVASAQQVDQLIRTFKAANFECSKLVMRATENKTNPRLELWKCSLEVEYFKQ